MKILFIVNPKANNGKSAEMPDIIREQMASSGRDFRIVLSEYAGHSVELAEKGAEEADLIVAVGGDGTINEVARGLVRAGKGVLGVLPSGTGNDIIKGFSWKKEVESSIQRLLHGRVREIDYGMVNEYFFLNIASIGLDAHAAKEASRFKWAGSISSYALGLMSSLFRFKGIPVTVDGKDRRILLLAVGNGKYYGGGFPMCIDAVWDDGLFDVVLVDNLKKREMFRLFPSLLKGKHLDKKEVDFSRKDSVTLIVQEPFFLNLDGEIVEMPGNTELHCTLVRNGIKIIDLREE